MTISPELLALVKSCEGLRLGAYQDSVGVWTQGYGRTGHHIGASSEPITADVAETWLAADLAGFQQGVDNLVQHLDLAPARRDALTDFGFNLGLAALASSTMLRHVLTGDFDAASAECRKWNHAGGIVLAGLTKRRNIEAGWLASGTYEP